MTRTGPVLTGSRRSRRHQQPRELRPGLPPGAGRRERRDPVRAGPVRVICVAGARPNYMKVKPVMDALEERAADVILVHTGQHYDAAMNDVFFADLGIRPPDHRLQVGSGSHATQTGKVMAAFEPLVAQLRPDVVVVVGDVNSTMGCALVTAKSGALLAH